MYFHTDKLYDNVCYRDVQAFIILSPLNKKILFSEDKSRFVSDNYSIENVLLI